MKTDRRLSCRVLLACLMSLIGAAPSAVADSPCAIERTFEVLSVNYIDDTYFGEQFEITYRVHESGFDPCGDPVQGVWEGSYRVFGDPGRSCTEPTTETVNVEVMGAVSCSYCTDPSGNVTIVCCENSDQNRMFPLNVTWPPSRPSAWRLATYADAGDPDCATLMLEYYDHPDKGVRMLASVIVDGARTPLSIDLLSDASGWASTYVCVSRQPCSLLAVAVDAIDQCDGTPGIRSQGMWSSHGASGCADEWLARDASSRGVYRTTTDGAGGTVTMSRQLPPGFASGFWTVLRDGAADMQALDDGAQPGGSQVTGAKGTALGITGATTGDLGVYTFWGIPSGGTADDAAAIDSMRLVADVGQPEFTLEPKPASVGAGEQVTFTAAASGASGGLIWRINGVSVRTPVSPAVTERSSVSVDGYLFEATLNAPGELQLRALDYWGFDGRPLFVTCEAWNLHGAVTSYQARLDVRSFPATMQALGTGPLEVTVRTISASGQNTYAVTTEVSSDLGQTWQAHETLVSHTQPGSLLSKIAFTSDFPCAAHLLVRGSVSDGTSVAGTLSRTRFEPYVARSACQPDDVDMTDFRCATCPPDVRVALDAPTGVPNPPFTITRTLPPGNWSVRWAYLGWLPAGLPPVPVVDGPTGRLASVASGSTTSALTIVNPTFEDLGSYAMLVRNLDESAGAEFCADIVEVTYDSCGRRVLASPASVRACPEVTEFVIEVTTARPGDSLWLQLDEVYNIFVESTPIAYRFDDPTIVGDEVSFVIVAETPTRLRVTNYAASSTKTFGGWVSSSAPCYSSSMPRFFSAVIWHLPSGSCATSNCPADVDGSLIVDSGDIALLLLDFGACEGCATDLDQSGTVDSGDIALALLDFGPCP